MSALVFAAGTRKRLPATSAACLSRARAAVRRCFSTSGSEFQGEEGGGTGDQGQQEQSRQAHEERRDRNYYSNVMHGAITRDTYGVSSNRVDQQVEGLGRLYVYQYHACPFCGKVKSFLDYYNIPYTLIEVHPLNKKQLPNRQIFLHDRQVPVLLAQPALTGGTFADAKVMHNSWAIIEAVMLHMVRTKQIPEEDYYRATSKVVAAWMKWIDERLIPHLFAGVHADGEDVQKFFMYLQEFPKFYKVGLSAKMMPQACVQLFQSQVFSLKQQYGIIEGREYDMLFDTIQEWTEVTGGSFHGGSSPDMADLTAFGVFRTFESLDIFDRILRDTDIGPWYDAMTTKVGEHTCSTHF